MSGSVRCMVDVVLPVLNEAEAIPWVLGRLPQGFRPIVVDNGSTDYSAAVAARFWQLYEARTPRFVRVG